MRYVTFSTKDNATRRLGALDGNAAVVDVQSLGASDGLGSMLDLIAAGPDRWAQVRDAIGEAGVGRTGTRYGLDEIRWHAPIPRPTKNVFCLGLNYRSHAIESATARGREVKIPEHPVIFTKAPTTVNGPFDDIPVDRSVTQQPDWEVELGVVIGTAAKNVTRADALAHVFGYTIINDVTARDLQARHIQWFKGKSLDGFCPMGPCIVTADEFGRPDGKRISLRINGTVKQDANTSDMLFPVDVIIEALSAGLTLEPGDVIATGTPEGIGLARTPPEFLQDGDLVEADIEGIGALKNRVRDLR